ncbi:Nucleoside-diphosphate-sugar epimerase [Flexibacter flexilis DSM 6793]|uniref:Nucleoside-diphosphate-sugar epimerase n=1 Tax=Flexibacter flexilis DSM 6793 TaxID=927664 RepID=A0A1I1I4I7_9BACT|nr:NAD-dependent epimerase/dehydratase family protein [Flexibacter flexilis]SFC31349.1 Nucleoside-diphosphate-sugar epimerase [Flexibacter flexilis DSM 6793]
MKFHLVSGACGFVGRNLVKRLLKITDDYIVMVDDLSTGTHPSTWLPAQGYTSTQNGDLEVINGRLLFFKADFREFLHKLTHQPTFLREQYGLDFERFTDVFHFAAIVGGRAKIDGDPMMVALDLAIDAEFFYWATRHKPARVMFPSSSAAYPVDLQAESGAIALRETDINFAKMGQPDMTYGWSKLTGEYLAKIAAQYYGISVACVRPFSGYGEDQDLSYPIPAIAARAARRENPFEVWGSGKQGRDFVHIDDCIDCILMAMDNIHDGSAINIGSGKLTSFLEIIELFSRFVGYEPTIKPLLDKPVGVHSRYAEMSHVNNTFGWKPKVSLEEGMRRVYEAALERVKAQTV